MTDRPAERTSRGPMDRGRDDTAVRPGLQRLREQAAAATSARRPNKSANGPRVVRPPRRARLRVTRVDPWSVMKLAFLLSIALGVVTIVSVLILWGVLGAAGVWDSINKSVNDIVGDGSVWNISDYLGTSRVVGFTMIIAVIDVVLLTAVATLGAFLYNMAAALLGGIELTLTEDD
jgi:hypothetical protein